MAKSHTKSGYRAEFLARTKAARRSRGFTQVQMAEILDMDQGKYKQYETRTYLPHDYVPRFCLVCGIDATWLFTGIGRMTIPPDLPIEQARARSTQRKRGQAALL
jgi:transcriptional regulator with XRE-family HTH domain